MHPYPHVYAINIFLSVCLSLFMFIKTSPELKFQTNFALIVFVAS